MVEENGIIFACHGGSGSLLDKTKQTKEWRQAMAVDMKQAIERVEEAFKAAGWSVCPWMKDRYGKAELERRDKYGEVYVGTFLNPFSVRRAKTNGGVYLWEDEIGRSGVTLEVEPVYRHNGTKENVSIRVTVLFHDAQPRNWLPKKEFYKEEEISIIKRDSPTDYTEGERKTCWNVCKMGFTGKVRAEGLTERKLKNLVRKVNEAADRFECPDYSGFEEDRANWHASTREEYERACAATRDPQSIPQH